MTGPVVLETPRLRLAPFAEEHLSERYVSWLNDPEAVRFSEQRHRRHSLESCRAYVRSFTGSPSRLWAVLTRQGEHVGNVTAAVDEANSLAELGILLGERTCWGQGLATEAWTAVADHCSGTSACGSLWPEPWPRTQPCCAWPKSWACRPMAAGSGTLCFRDARWTRRTSPCSAPIG